MRFNSSFRIFVFVKFLASRFRALYKNENDIWHVTLDKIVERTVKLNLNAPFARLYLCVIRSFVSLFPWFIEKKMYFRNRYKIQRTSLSLSTARFNSFWRTPSVNILLNNYEQLFTTIRLLRYHNERFFLSTVGRFPLLNVVRRVPNKKIRDDCEKVSTKLKHLLPSHFLTNYVT